MKVVADTHVLVVSAATLADLWYASRKTSSAAIAPGVHEQIQATVLDPTTNLLLQPVSAATMAHFGAVPLEELRDVDALVAAMLAKEPQAQPSAEAVCYALVPLSSGGGPATEPERAISRFGEVRVGAPGGIAGVVSVRSGSFAAHL
ncbi:MAG: hypothetical protein M3Y48_11665 [Actinomycetota bacterium]|nr:hypothetical protein [Actinomycetota bacterium]